MKRKNGFTLIELLAVIVILAIIALIAVPVVMNIISKANKSAFKDSAYGMLKAGENYYMGELLNAQGMTEDKVFDFSNDTSELEINGSKPTDGKMIVRKDGKISMAIHNGKHCVTKGFEDDDVTITDDIGNCKIPGVNTLSDLVTTGTFEFSNGISPVEVNEVDACAKSGEVCEQGTPFAIKVNNNATYKFYVLSDTGSEVTLIMDRNLYSATDENDGNVAWCNLDDYKLAGGTEEQYGEYGNNNKGPLTALKVLKQRTSGWTNIPTFTYTLKNDADSEDGEYTYPDITGELVTNVRARLPRLEELRDTEGGCEIDSCVSWLTVNADEYLANGYWTSTTYSSWQDSAYRVTMGYPGLGAQTGSIDLSIQVGLRPVITLSK